jgi:hypothetical protein
MRLVRGDSQTAAVRIRHAEAAFAIIGLQELSGRICDFTRCSKASSCGWPRSFKMRSDGCWSTRQNVIKAPLFRSSFADLKTCPSSLAGSNSESRGGVSSAPSCAPNPGAYNAIAYYAITYYAITYYAMTSSTSAELVGLRRIALFTAVTHTLVAAGATGSTLFAFFEVERHEPASERKLATYEQGLAARVYVMAGTAGSSLPLLVHMHVVEVASAIAKAGDFAARLDRRHVLFMAGETQPVVFGVEFCVETRRKWLLEHAKIFASMGIVTRGTVILDDWLVPYRVLFEMRSHVDQLAASGFDRPIVATET